MQDITGRGLVQDVDWSENFAIPLSRGQRQAVYFVSDSFSNQYTLPDAHRVPHILQNSHLFHRSGHGSRSGAGIGLEGRAGGLATTQAG